MGVGGFRHTGPQGVWPQGPTLVACTRKPGPNKPPSSAALIGDRRGRISPYRPARGMAARAGYQPLAPDLPSPVAPYRRQVRLHHTSPRRRRPFAGLLSVSSAARPREKKSASFPATPPPGAAAKNLGPAWSRFLSCGTGRCAKIEGPAGRGTDHSWVPISRPARAGRRGACARTPYAVRRILRALARQARVVLPGAAVEIAA